MTSFEQYQAEQGHSRPMTDEEILALGDEEASLLLEAELDRTIGRIKDNGPTKGWK